MKSLLLLLVVSSSSHKAGPDTQSNEWTPVSNYLASHTTNYDPSIDARLCEEASAGQKTWTVALSTTSRSPGDPGLGWPSEDCVLRFNSVLEVALASQMILDVTLGQPKR